MKKHLLLFLTLVFLSLACGSDDSPEPKTFETLSTELQTIINDYTQNQGVIGISSSVIIDQIGTWNGVSGVSREGFPITPDMKFGIASVTKTAVTAIIMQLVQEGELSLNDPIGNWLVDFQNIDGAVTVRQVLNHQSGIYDFVDHPEILQAVTNEPTKVWAPEEVLNNFILSPVFSPGARFGYSNSNFTILGMIIESVVNKPMDVILRERLWQPFGLNSFFLPGFEIVPGPRATGWSADGLTELSSLLTQRATHSIRWAAGGLVANAEDLAKWGETLYSGQVVSGASLNQMTSFVPISAGNWTGYGLGTQRYSFSSQVEWGHTGNLREYSSILVYEPRNKISVALLINQGNVSTFAIMGDLFNAITAFMEDTQ